MAKKNTMVVRNNTALNGIEIIFAEKASADVRKKLNGERHKVDGYKYMTFRWKPDTALWYATNCKRLNKQVTKLIKELRENGYIDDETGEKVKVTVIDKRTVEPENETAPTTTRRSNRRGGYRRSSTATTTGQASRGSTQTDR